MKKVVLFILFTLTIVPSQALADGIIMLRFCNLTIATVSRNDDGSLLWAYTSTQPRSPRQEYCIRQAYVTAIANCPLWPTISVPGS